ncbi:hypothetical protein CC78DRAFT_529168 [Lojkania enalia]|uniref:Uncharacterized protein n=1 Tax=Lojkania enalia TaxID=147567 RepID=A0A9P4TQE2_9PLEO|nr:hypothetical protein CC78DRAFT_529168 [Didymosphaeria enalia]
MARESITTPKRGRGRPAKATGLQAVPPVAQEEQPKRRGRPARSAATDATIATPTVRKDDGVKLKRRGRPKKTDTATTNARRTTGRVAKTAKAPIASGVIGSPRVAKRTSPRKPKSTRRPTATPTSVSKRVKTATPKEPALAKPTNTRRKGKPKLGRPPKNAAATPSKKKAGVPIKADKGAVRKPVARRAKKGHTSMDIPKQYVARIQKLLKEWQDEEAERAANAQNEETEPVAAYVDAIVDDSQASVSQRNNEICDDVQEGAQGMAIEEEIIAGGDPELTEEQAQLLLDVEREIQDGFVDDTNLQEEAEQQIHGMMEDAAEVEPALSFDNFADAALEAQQVQLAIGS